jgi:hypothetical protein
MIVSYLPLPSFLQAVLKAIGQELLERIKGLKVGGLANNPRAALTTDSDSISTVEMSSSTILGVGDIVKLLWSWSKFNLSPGPELLQELTRQWPQSIRHQQSPGQAGAQLPPPPPPPPPASQVGKKEVKVDFHELTVVLYSLSIMHEHSSPLAHMAAQQLQDLLRMSQVQKRGLERTMMRSRNQENRLQGENQPDHPQQQQQQQDEQASPASPPSPSSVPTSSPYPESFRKQLRQVAAAMLSSQAERQTSPLVSVLSPETRALAMQDWRDHVSKKAAKEPNRCRRVKVGEKHVVHVKVLCIIDPLMTYTSLPTCLPLMTYTSLPTCLPLMTYTSLPTCLPLMTLGFKRKLLLPLNVWDLDLR